MAKLIDVFRSFVNARLKLNVDATLLACLEYIRNSFLFPSVLEKLSFTICLCWGGNKKLTR
jgi:hypothetical protein